MSLRICSVKLTSNMHLTFCIHAAICNMLRATCIVTKAKLPVQRSSSGQSTAAGTRRWARPVCLVQFMLFILCADIWQMGDHPSLGFECGRGVGVLSVWRLRCALIFLTIRCRLTCAIHQPPAGHSQRRAVSMCLRVHVCVSVFVCVSECLRWCDTQITART